MNDIEQPPPYDELNALAWRKSTFSGDQGACVEAAPLPDGRIAVRNSNHPDAGAVHFTVVEMDAWIKGVKAGEFDYLVGE
ncbi:DUF397 domain-containing protein [Streptomyces sp. NBC_01500]|uniref:DUF397 domain-containing protein n=1 Tax=Streptomyces sp. NBC_01500 TaxID=2903886 RepID=UPI002259E1BC|nr:DUF397 domain-containing protein [Streptomyces sp. NBC_01500]MCX4552545.1 DUF397 domain-containing protein [Streptomyces sp. NBC_01500]